LSLSFDFFTTVGCATQDLDMLYPQEALQELTSDISKLVNLRVLKLDCNDTVDNIPDSISCLQKLETLFLEYASGITEVPVGLATLKNLACLRIIFCEDLRFPPNLQVRDLGFAAWRQPLMLCGSH
jgi:hypothetical protein